MPVRPKQLANEKAPVLSEIRSGQETEGASAVTGFVAPGFEEVGEAFDKALAASHGHGSALHIRQDGTCVVDLWGGQAAKGRPWQAETPSVIFSCTKGLLAILAGELVGQGLLDLDAPVRELWPEFSQNGKSEIPVRWLLTHRAGLPVVRQDLQLSDVLDWDVMVDILAREEPLITPGAGHVYHPLTYGWLVGEVIRRASGAASVGELFAARVARPLNARAWIGTPQSELAGIAYLYDVPGAMPPETLDPETERWMTKAVTMGHAFPITLVTPDGGFNRDDVRMAQVAGAGGVASPRALATIWSATVSDNEELRLLGPDVIADMTREQSSGTPVWAVPGPHPRWASGFMLSSVSRPMLSESSFGHGGAGGQVAFADAEHKIGFAYLTNDLQGPDDERATKVVRALQRILKVQG